MFSGRPRLSELNNSNAQEVEQDQNGIYRLTYRPQGWDYWTYEGHKVHFLRAGAVYAT